MKTILAYFFLLLVVGCGTETAPVVPNPDATKQDECASNARAYLLGLQTGDSVAAAGFWKPGVTSKTLFAVHDFQELTHGNFLNANGEPYKIPRIHYKFEIESSTKGGIPIRKRWDIIMEPTTKNYGGFLCSIVDLTEAE